jgi:hypothetical protein
MDLDGLVQESFSLNHKHTERVQGKEGKTLFNGDNNPVLFWIPAFAGMTAWGWFTFNHKRKR